MERKIRTLIMDSFVVEFREIQQDAEKTKVHIWSHKIASEKRVSIWKS